MTLTFSSFSFLTLFTSWHKPFAPVAAPRHSSDAEDARADRALAMDTLARNPDAIDSELGLLILMTRFPIH